MDIVFLAAAVVAILGAAARTATWWWERRQQRSRSDLPTGRVDADAAPGAGQVHPESDSAYPDGIAVRERADERVFIIVGGAKVWLPGPAWLERYGEPQIRVVPSGSLAGLPEVPRDGTLVREWSDLSVFIIHGGHRSIVDAESGDEDPSLVQVVPDGALARIPLA